MKGINIRLTFLIIFLLITMGLFSRDPVKVACIGNSITYGSGIEDRTKTYPAVLGKMLGNGYEVMNYGVGGRTLLSQGDYPWVKEPIYQEALAWQPDIVIIKLGTNDSKPQNWEYRKYFKKDYQRLIKSFQKLKSKPDVYLCLVVPVFEDRWGIRHDVVENEINPLVHIVAHKRKCEVIDLNTPFIRKEHMFPDKVHPNAAGAAEMARVVYNELKKMQEGK